MKAPTLFVLVLSLIVFTAAGADLPEPLFTLHDASVQTISNKGSEEGPVTVDVYETFIVIHQPNGWIHVMPMSNVAYINRGRH